MMRISTVSCLQIFQLTRYAGLVLTSICFAWMGIGKDKIGSYESFLLRTGFFSFFLVAGLINSMLSVYPLQSDKDKKQLLFTGFCLMLMLSALAGMVQLFTRGTVLGLLFLMLNNTAYMAEYILFLQDRRRILIIYGMATAIGQALLCALPAYIYGETRYSIYGLIVAAGARFLFVIYQLSQHTIMRFEFDKLKHLLLLSLPLMLSFFVSGSAEYIDGAVVRRYFSLADFSIFRYGSKEFPLFTILAATLSMSMIPRVAANLSDGLASIRRESAKYMHFFFPLAIVLILCGQWLFSLVFTPKFAESGRIFSALMLLTVPRLLFPQSILTALKESRWILSAAIIEMIINIAASVLLALRFGLSGVAYGTLIAFLAEKVVMMAVLYYKHGILPSRYVSLAPFSIYTLLVLISYTIAMHINL